MKRFTHRLLPLVLCLSLTLGAFVYRPPEAQAIAGVDDAVVIGALLTAFSAGCGLIFANNGMTSNEIAQGMTQKWNEFKDTLSTVPSSFASWLGYDSTEELLASCVIVGPSKMNITRPIARKFAEFTDWLVKDVGLTPDGSSIQLLPYPISLSNLSWTPDRSFTGDMQIYFSCSLANSSLRLESSVSGADNRSVSGWLFSEHVPVSVSGDYTFNFSGVETHSYKAAATSSPSVGFRHVGLSIKNASDDTVGGYTFLSSVSDSFSGSCTVFIPAGSYFRLALAFESNSALSLQSFQWSGSVSPSTPDSLSVHAPAGVQMPSLDIPAEGTDEVPITISGVGTGAATIEDLLQQILAQVQANTLAPTIEGVDTETGGGTDTEEDAKPYLPYIPQIFGKIKDLPDTLSNIWESIKGLPAAIAEKIGAFFTTLWGWLQSIIDAIKALPTAIAEKIAALFTPDEALVTEITDTFNGKFGFISTLKQFGNDLFGMTAETEPPVIWVHFENAESKYGYDYGGKEKMLDLSWYQKYKANVDTLISGFLWLGFLWLLFKRAAAIIQGGEMLAEYGHDLSQGRRDSNETKFQRYLWKD